MNRTLDSIISWAKTHNVKVDLLSRCTVNRDGYSKDGEYFGHIPGTYILIVEGVGDRTLTTGEPTRAYMWNFFRVPTSLRRDVVKRALKKVGCWEDS